MIRLLSLLVVLLIFNSCGSSPEEKSETNIVTEDSVALNFEVIHYGALKNFMHKNDVSAKFDLNELADSENVFALGALENLKGEILIWDGDPLLSIVNENNVEIQTDFNKKAALVVYAQVSEWVELKIESEIKTYEALEELVAKEAGNNGIDISKPFPFLLKGEMDTLKWHVIDWPEGDSVHTHQKHVESGLNGSITSVNADILGFYSDAHHAVFTHHSTNMHLHFKAGDTLAGHVDGLYLGDDVILLLPKTHK